MRTRSRRSAAGLAALATLASLGEVGCAGLFADQSYWMARGTEPAASGARLVLAPINFRDALPYPLAPRLALVQRELESYLLERQIEPLRVGDREFDEMWTGAIREVGGLNDIPDELVRERYEAAMAKTVATLSERAKDGFDALVVPTVIYRTATVSGFSASWDHVMRDLPVSATPPANATPDVATPTSIPALSLRIEVFDGGGARVFVGYGGLELPERLDLATNMTQPRGDALIDSNHIREALGLALAPFLPPPSEE